MDQCECSVALAGEGNGLVVVESGEYSDFVYLPLVVPLPFDAHAVLEAFTMYVQRRFPDLQKYSINAGLAPFLVRAVGARSPGLGEAVRFIGVLADPIHYGSWEPDADWGHLRGKRDE